MTAPRPTAPPRTAPVQPVTVDDLLAALETVTRSADEFADTARRATADVEAQGRRNQAQARQIVQLEAELRRSRAAVEVLTDHEAHLVADLLARDTSLAAAREEVAALQRQILTAEAAQIQDLRPGGTLPPAPLHEREGGEAFIPTTAHLSVAREILEEFPADPSAPNMCDRPGCGHPKRLHTFDGCIDRCACDKYQAPKR